MESHRQPKPNRPSSRNEFEIALICALTVEFNAVEALFDGFWEDEHQSYGRAPGDTNAYTIGWMNCHNVVLASMPGIGKANAATVAAFFRASFPNIKLALLVGICGGAPSGQEDQEILLGDTIISTGIVQFDLARQYPDQTITRDILEGNVGPVDAKIRSFVNKLGSRLSRQLLTEKAWIYLQNLQKYDDLKARYPGAENDNLYEPNYRHKHQDSHGSCSTCIQCDTPDSRTCELSRKSNCGAVGCSDAMLVTRVRKSYSEETAQKSLGEVPEDLRPAVHLGLFASGDIVMKSGLHRDAIVDKHDVIAFEMEGSGAWNIFPTIVIKAVCDYADSHKNKAWQSYSAACAAAYMKSLLWHWRVADLTQNHIPNIPHTLQENSQEKDYIECVRSLHFPSMFSRQDMIVSRAPNTFEWIWHPHSNFVRWLHEGSGIYWVTGKPGSGKSTMLKYLLDDYLLDENSRMISFLTQSIDSTTSNDQNPILLSYFFYFDGESPSRRLTGMLRSFLWQLLKAKPYLFDELRRNYLDMVSYHSILEWTITILTRSFKKMLHLLVDTRVVILVDALDEFDGEDREIANFFDQLSNETSSNVTFLLSSRPYPDFSYDFDGYVKLKMHENTSKDVLEYVQQRFSYVNDRLGPDTQKLTLAIVSKAEGVFFWVKLVCDDLQRGWTRFESPEKLWERLHRLPAELNKLYDRIFDEMDGDDREQALKVLEIISCAYRPLHVRELCFALDFSTGRPGLAPYFDATPTDFEKALQIDEFKIIERSAVEHTAVSTKRIDAICRGLAQVSKKYVELSHETVSGFLKARAQENGHILLLKACLYYMETLFASTPEFQWSISRERPGENPILMLNGTKYVKDRQYGQAEYGSSVKAERQWETPFALMNYSASFWNFHAKETEKATGDSNLDLLRIFSCHAFEIWQIYSFDRRSLYLAAGWLRLTRKFRTKSFFTIALASQMELYCIDVLTKLIVGGISTKQNAKKLEGFRSACDIALLDEDSEDLFVLVAEYEDFETAQLLLKVSKRFAEIVSSYKRGGFWPSIEYILSVPPRHIEHFYNALPMS